jgi:hypothetical protein
MCRLIDEVAKEKGINPEDANCIFTFVSAHLLSKVPELNQVFNDVFENADAAQLQQHLHHAIDLMQQHQWDEKFKDCIIPPQSHVSLHCGGGELF